MNQNKQLSLRLELIWWVVTFIIIIGAIFPIYQVLDEYPFLVANIIFIVVFITLARYIFLLKHTFIAKKQRLKIVLLFLCIPLAFYLIDQINHFRAFLDEDQFEVYVKNLSLSQRSTITKYITAEYLFFSVGALISTIIFPFRMLKSVWRVRNRGTV
ncbi:hypothetical protein OAF63_03075 [Saprospiraceae bacterium]|jgi:hypothetical protein|nr:hypothetical protein [Bacteroidota bacterium]MDB4727749.1 hypothetical protein [Saprospiraceae bacterium]MDF1863251.1 hypothetical protein [Saprospiraceae bacterium]